MAERLSREASVAGDELHRLEKAHAHSSCAPPRPRAPRFSLLASRSTSLITSVPCRRSLSPHASYRPPTLPPSHPPAVPLSHPPALPPSHLRTLTLQTKLPSSGQPSALSSSTSSTMPVIKRPPMLAHTTLHAPRTLRAASSSSAVPLRSPTALVSETPSTSSAYEWRSGHGGRTSGSRTTSAR
jgi:hypothetical protein